MIKTREGYKFYTVEDIQKYATEMAMKYILDGYKMAAKFSQNGGFNLEKDGNHVHIIIDMRARPSRVGVADEELWLECATVEVVETTYDRPMSDEYKVKACWFRVAETDFYVEHSGLAFEFCSKHWARRSAKRSSRVIQNTVITGERLRPIMKWVNEIEGCKSLKLKNVELHIHKNDRYVQYSIYKVVNDKNTWGSKRNVWDRTIWSRPFEKEN